MNERFLALAGGGGFATSVSKPLTDPSRTVVQEFGGRDSGVLEQYLALPPLIRVPQGEEIRVFVNRDLIFK